jgi:hypothetical protein
MDQTDGFALYPGVSRGHTASVGVGPILQERSSLGLARVKYTLRTVMLKATPASYLSMVRERIEFGKYVLVICAGG